MSVRRLSIVGAIALFVASVAAAVAFGHGRHEWTTACW
jgi:hypothetical protein